MTAERYTAVFTGLFAGKEPGEYLYMTLSEDSGTVHRGRPPYGDLGREVPFPDLPEGCRCLILDVYCDLWDLCEEHDASPHLPLAAGRDAGARGA